MLNICSKLCEADAKVKRQGIVRTEADYHRALLDAMANMDRLVEVEVLKSLGDVSLEKGNLDKNSETFYRAMMLYRTALIRCEDANVRKSLEYRCNYADKLRLRHRPAPSSFRKEQRTSLVKITEKLQHLDRRLATGDDKDSLLTEYTKLMIEGIVNKDNVLEVEALKSLGDVYLKRGRETRETTCLTKATALYNTALERCEGVQGTAALIHRLLYTARVRQESTRIKKGLKYRKQPQQQQHLSQKFPVMSANTDVMDNITCQQFMTPSTFIACQTTVKTNPDYRSYEEYLATGDCALTDRDLDTAEEKFASALKLIHDHNKPDRCKEAECLRRLGDIYLLQGERTKEGRKFTQAAALYNAAMFRTDKDREKLITSLREVEKSFLRYTAELDCEPSSYDLAMRHKNLLGNMRTNVKAQLEAIDQQHNPYQYDEDDQNMFITESDRAEAIKMLFKSIAKDRQTFIKDLVDECINVFGPPPCKYAFIGLGSQATELVTPYSDLEFAILIEEGNDSEDTRRYFINLTHYLHLKVINLGETILPAMAIPSLNDFLSEDPEKNWFFDSITPRGFAFDGFMPWASKTPFGRDQTKTKSPLSLIQTPSNLAKCQQLEVSLAEGYHLSDILRRFAFMAGEESLANEYMEKLNRNMADNPLSYFQSRLSADQMLKENMEGHFHTCEPCTGELLNVKNYIYRFPGIAIELLALCCQITCASTWSVIDELKDRMRIHEVNATHLTVLTSISAELRLRTYIANGGQKDSLSPLTKIAHQPNTCDVSDSTLKSVFHIQDTKILFRYFFRAIPLKLVIPQMVKDSMHLQPKMVLKTILFDTSHECRGRIAGSLLMPNESRHHWEVALEEEGENTLKRAEILNGLGNAWTFHWDNKKAISYYEQSLQISKSFSDKWACRVIAGTLSNLGSCWNMLGNQKKAISYHDQSLAMRKTIHGDTAHSDIAESLTNIGLSWSANGDHKKAICYFEQALTEVEAIPRNRKARQIIAKLYHCFGSCWSELGNQTKAISYCEQSLTKWRTIYGDKTAHPEICSSLTTLGSCWLKTGDDQHKAISYFEQSLTLSQAIYGDNIAHREIAKSLNYLGLSWCELGDHSKGSSYLEQSLTMMKTIHGDKAHPDIAVVLSNMASFWSKLGDQNKTISYYEQSLAMWKVIYSDNPAHKDIATSLDNLGLSWREFGDWEKAFSYYEQSLNMWKTIHGDKTSHSDIAMSLGNLGSCWCNLGDHRKGISYLEQSLKMTQTIYGDKAERREIACFLGNLGSAWFVLGDHNKAVGYFKQSLATWKALYGDEADTHEIASTLEYLGLSSSELGNQKKAISYLEQSLMVRKTIHEEVAHPDIAKLFDTLGASWSKLGDHEKAISYCEQSLTMWKTIFGDMAAQPEIAISLNNLGLSWGEFGNQSKAIGYHEQSLKMRRTIYGDKTVCEHPDIAKSLHNLGSCWGKLGDPKKAISYSEQSLAMRRSIYGDDMEHQDIAHCLVNLGSSWCALGNEDKAIGYFEQSLTMSKTIHGDETPHPDIAKTLGFMGLCRCKLGNLEEAIRYFEQSLMMWKTIYGDETPHPRIAESLHSVGTCWSNLGDHRKAISYLKQCLTMKKTIYGNETPHPDIAKCFQIQGLCWFRLSDHKKAISYFEQSLTMWKIIYGDKMANPDIADSLHNLGACWSELGDHKKAISYFNQSLTMMETVYRDKTTPHPGIARALCNLGLCWHKLGEQQKAISYFEQSLTTTKAICEDQTSDPGIALLLATLGTCWRELSDLEKAISYYEQSLRVLKTIHGDNTAHPDIANTLSKLGLYCNELGDENKAISYYEQSLAMMKTIHGDNTAHPDIASLLNELGISWSKLSDGKKAIAYFEQSLAMMTSIYGDNMFHPNIVMVHRNIVSHFGNRWKAFCYYLAQSLMMSETNENNGLNSTMMYLAICLVILSFIVYNLLNAMH